MRSYEVTFIVDPVLSGDEIKSTAQTYVEMLRNEGCEIVHVEETGLKSLAYPINKRHSGVYFCIEFKLDTPIITKLELALRRDERIMRFLTVALDKFGVKYNEDKRNGKIGKRINKPAASTDQRNEPAPRRQQQQPTPAPQEEKPVEAVAAPVAAPEVAVENPVVVAEDSANTPANDNE